MADETELSRREVLAGAVMAMALPIIGGGQVTWGATDSDAAALAVSSDGYVATVKPASIKPGDFVTTWAKSGKFVLARDGDKVYALNTVCTHRGGPVSPRKGVLTCAFHGAQFDITGAVTKGPAKRDLARLAVRLNADGVIEVGVKKIVKTTDSDASVAAS